MESGDVFENKDAVLRTIFSLCEGLGKQYKVAESKKNSILIRCPDKSCTFAVRCSRKAGTDTFRVTKRLDLNHTCVENIRRKRNVKKDVILSAASSSISKHVGQKKKNNAKALVQALKDDGITINIGQARNILQSKTSTKLLIKEELYEMIKEMVAIPSDSSNISQCYACLNYVRNYFKETDWKVREIRKSGEKTSPMLYVSKDINRFHTKLLLLVHLDVVPCATYEMTGSVEDRVFGRGVSDMKGPSAVLMSIMKRLDPLKHDMALLVVTDEEIGGIDGAKYAFQDEDGPHISCDVAHCPDGGDFFKLVTHEKGVLRFKAEIEGKAAHSAYPWLGVNAIEYLIEDLRLMKNALNPNGNKVFDQNNLEWHTTMNISEISGGTAINMVPATASANVDIRFTEQWSIPALKQILADNVQYSKISYFFEQNMLNIGIHNRYIQEAREILETVLKREIMYSRGHGTSDGHWASFPTIMFKPDGGGLHQDDEWLDFNSLLDYYNICEKLILKWSQ